MRARPTIRARLTALYALVVLVGGGLLLAVSYALLDSHLHATLTDQAADDVLRRLRTQYALALVTVTALAVLLGWLIADRALAPLRSITGAARSVSGESLDSRVALQGPDDELRELADTFDEMLDRLDAAFAGQRRFVANASHELRTPLTVLRTEVEVALADPDASAAELRATAEVVREEVGRLEHLLESLLALARSEAAALAHDDAVDLAATAGRVAARVGADARLQDIRLELEARQTVVRGDGGLLEQLVFNLVENAVTYNEPGGWARVSVAQKRGCCAIRVENSGPLVPDRELELLTEPFKRLERRNRRGAGVGLSIVRAVAAAHGGRLELTAREEGGLVAEVFLPLAYSREPAGGSRSAGQSPYSQVR